MEIQHLIIIGKGKWGSALGSAAQDSGIKVSYLGREHTMQDWKKKLTPKSFVLIATPFSEVAKIIRRLSSFKEISGVINASKGIDHRNLKSFSGLADGQLKLPFATLSGPSFAKELKQRKPTAVVLAGKDKNFVKDICKSYSNSYFRLYAHSDPIGVEVCGATKNILAIATGITDGLKLGLNARAALLSRGVVEMTKIVEAMGGQSSTVFGLAGLGDLWLTATGKLSRNRQLGLLLATGMDAKQALKQVGETVEGLYTVKQVEKIRRSLKLNLPISEQIYQVCVRNKSAAKAAKELMTRGLKTEESSSWRLS